MILKPNKYLKEIGIDEKYWLFNNSNELDTRYVPDEEGFVDAEHFNLDTSLSLYIYSQLCYFRENCMVGHPGYLSEEKWKGIIDSMIEAFKLMIIDDTKVLHFLNDGDRKKLSKNKNKKIKYGMRLFIKYYNDLWY